MAMAENCESDFFDLIRWRNPVLRDGDGKRVYKVIGPDLQVRGSFYACSHSKVAQSCAQQRLTLRFFPGVFGNRPVT